MMRKKLILFFSLIFIIAAVSTVAVFSATDNTLRGESGIKFTSSDYYQSIDTMTDIPLTFEAWVKVDPDTPNGTAIGTMAGNYADNTGGYDSACFLIAELGAPRVYFKPYDSETGTYGAAIDFRFPDVDLRTGELTHLAITLDPTNKTAYCYVNGELKETYTGEKWYYNASLNDGKGGYDKFTSTMDISPIAQMDITGNIAVGRDKRNSNTQYLNGNYAELYSVTMFSDIRSADEIVSDMSALEIDESVIVSYDLTASGSERLRDYSQNENHLYYTNTSDASLDEYYKLPGIKFTSSDYYESQSALSAMPLTFEAWVKVADKSEAPSGTPIGPIFGNYAAGNETYAPINFEIAENGVPKLYIRLYDEEKGTAASDAIQIYFPEIDLRNGKLTHIAVTLDPENNKAYAYVNGSRKQTFSGEYYYYSGSEGTYKQSTSKSVDISGLANITKLGNIAIGRDHRSGTYLKYLNGDYAELYSVKAFSDVRSADEIKTDMFKVDGEESDLIISYELTVSGKDRLCDHSSNENHLCYSSSSAPSLGEWYSLASDGFDFSYDEVYRTENIPSELPLTIEATVWFPNSPLVKKNGGVIAGTAGIDKRYINFEIVSGGKPKLVWADENGSVQEFIFDDVSVYTGEYTHIALTVDRDESKIHCYVDGILRQSIAFSELSYAECCSTWAIGGDFKKNNPNCFTGKLISCALYSDTRTAEEIARDTAELDSNSLLFAYNYSASSDGNTHPEYLTDLSSNGNNAIIPVYFIGDTVSSNFDAAYSFAVVGDTQSISYYYPEKMSVIYDWIVDNIENKNIKFVMGLGDITEKNADAEWTVAKQTVGKLHGKVPYSVAVGNHDTAEKLTNTFDELGYRDIISGSFGSGLENTYQYLTVGEVDYIIFALDCGASDEVLAWAGEIIAAHPKHNVIITTHAYLNKDGTKLDSSDIYSVSNYGYSNDGSDIWDKLVSKYENIVLVLSGHISNDEIVMSKSIGENGNTVTGMLIDPQAVDAMLFPTRLVAMLHFSEDGKEVRVEYYSTIQEQYFMYDNQFETSLDTVDVVNVTFVPDQGNTELNVTDKWLVGETPLCDGRSYISNDGKLYTFLGWSTDKNATQPETIESLTMTDMANGVTYYAVYSVENELMQCNLTLYSDFTLNLYFPKQIFDNYVSSININGESITLSLTVIIDGVEYYRNTVDNIGAAYAAESV